MAAAASGRCSASSSDGVNLLAEDGSHPKGAEITTGHPQFDHVLLKKLGWWDELTDEEKKEAEGKTWANDLSGGIQRVAMKHGCHPFGNAKARAVVWNFPDAVPAAPRAAVQPAAGHGREVSDPRRREGVLAPADAVQVGAAAGGQGGAAQEVSAHPHQRPARRVRGRRRGDALQPLARRAACRTTSSRSTPSRRPTAAFATASTCGSARRARTPAAATCA